MDTGLFYTILISSAVILLFIDLASCEVTRKTSEKSPLKPHTGQVQLRKQSPARSTMFGYNSSQSFKDSAKKLEQAIEYSDRKILEEYHSFAFGLQVILKHVEMAARKCGCKSMYAPILDSKKRLTHGLNAVSNKLRSDTIRTNHQ